MLQNKTIEIAFPLNTNLDDFVFHYQALLNAHGVKNNLPNCVPTGERLTNALKESHDHLLQDFKNVDAHMYRYKAEFGDVEITDMKIVGNRAYIMVALGR